MRKIFIDTDCGIDDAVALMMALSYDDVEIVGISTVSGNVPVDQVTENVLRILSYFGRDRIPVYKGASQPLLEQPRRAEGVHGKNGLGDVQLPETLKTQERQSAPEGLRRALTTGDKATVVALGPLTNIAITLNLYPELKDYIHEIVVMGGAIETGNITTFAEFNFFADPEAVQFVLDSGVPLTIVPWDTCLQISHSEEEIASLGLEGSKAGDLFLAMYKTPLRFMERVYGKRAVAFADPATMACFLEPGVVMKTIHSDLRMELGNSTLRGASIRVSGERLKLIIEIDKKRFADVLLKLAYID